MIVPSAVKMVFSAKPGVNTSSSGGRGTKKGDEAEDCVDTIDFFECLLRGKQATECVGGGEFFWCPRNQQEHLIPAECIFVVLVVLVGVAGFFDEDFLGGLHLQTFGAHSGKYDHDENKRKHSLRVAVDDPSQSPKNFPHLCSFTVLYGAGTTPVVCRDRGSPASARFTGNGGADSSQKNKISPMTSSAE